MGRNYAPAGIKALQLQYVREKKVSRLDLDVGVAELQHYSVYKPEQTRRRRVSRSMYQKKRKRNLPGQTDQVRSPRKSP